MRIVLVVCVGLLVALPAGADQSWKETEGYKALRKQERKVLAGLLAAAGKEELPRQAWYFADRILAIDPDDEDALAVAESWEPERIIEGEAPDKRFVKKRDAALERLGDDVFHFGETLEAAGVDPVHYYEINQRAHAYGSTAGPLVAALEGAGYAWFGTFLDREVAEVRKILGTALMESAAFPPEFDDALLRYRPLWPGVTIAEVGTWRVVTDRTWQQGMETLAIVYGLERFAIEELGKGKPDDELTDLCVFKDIETFDKVAPDYVREADDREKLRSRSAWHRGSRRRSLVSAVDRHNPWITPEAQIQGQVGRILASTRYGSGRGWVRGKGAWIISGVRGLFEGLQKNAGGTYEFAPSACWRLALARALRDSGQALSWDALFELEPGDRRDPLAHDVPGPDTITVHVNGRPFEAKNVDIVAAQATALVAGVYLSHPKRGPKTLAKLLEAFFKRGGLPDIEKALKWKQSRIAEAADAAMDQVDVPKPKAASRAICRRTSRRASTRPR